MPNFYWTVLHCDRSVGPKPRYHKWALMKSFIFVFSVIIKHDFISDFIVVVNSFSIFADIFLIYLSLLFLEYQFLTHRKFYW